MNRNTIKSFQIDFGDLKFHQMRKVNFNLNKWKNSQKYF